MNRLTILVVLLGSVLCHRLKHRLKAGIQMGYQYLGVMDKKNCKWLDFMYEQTVNQTDVPEYLRDKFIQKGEDCTENTCKTRIAVLDEAVCKAFELYPHVAAHEGLYYAQTIRVYNQTTEIDEYKDDFLAQYLFMVLPSQLKYLHKNYKPKLVSVVVPIKKGEEAFSMRNCPLDFSDTDTMVHFQRNDLKEECIRKVDFDRITIRHVGPEERNRTWGEQEREREREQEEEMETSIFR